MNNVLLPIALWTTLILIGLSILGIGVSGLMSLWYGKVRPLTVGIVAAPAVVMLVLKPVFGSWARAGVYTLLFLFVCLALGMLGTGLRQVIRGAFR